MSLSARGVGWTVAAILLIAAALAIFYVRQASQRVEVTVASVSGSAEAGREAIVAYGCGGCHEIAGIPRASGRVGPPLTGVAGRRYLGGQLVNTPANMARWIRHPQAFAPGTAMPDLGVSENEARDIAAYLYRLR